MIEQPGDDRRPVVVLVSGGLDSVTALYEAHASDRVVLTMSFDYGAKHNGCELPMAAWHAEALGVPHRVIPMASAFSAMSSALLVGGAPIPDGHYEESMMKQTVVPFRNGIMLAVATGVGESAGAEGVVIAAHAGDHAIYPDCRESFMVAMGGAMAAGSYAGVALLRPFIALSKADIVRRGVALGVDYSRTWSCYKGGHLHCGTCGTCVERREAFLDAGVVDPTVYQREPALPSAPGGGGDAEG
jgi:7-cyano-7-deazaguanine synthase